MATKDVFTTGDLATEYQLPEWLVRRIVDALGEEIPRAGQYRLIPRAILGRVEEELRRRGHLPQEVEVVT